MSSGSDTAVRSAVIDVVPDRMVEVDQSYAIRAYATTTGTAFSAWPSFNLVIFGVIVEYTISEAL